MNKLWHHPKKLDDGNFLIKISKRKAPIEISIPNDLKEIKTIEQAICFITMYPHNLMRVSGYKCDNHNKYHRFSFHSYVSVGFPVFYGFDKEKDVIEFAKNWNSK